VTYLDGAGLRDNPTEPPSGRSAGVLGKDTRTMLPQANSSAIRRHAT
jgi:hypothetical protein